MKILLNMSYESELNECKNTHDFFLKMKLDALKEIFDLIVINLFFSLNF